MNNFEDLAQILEEAARQLRIAGKALEAIPSLGLSMLLSSDFSVRTWKCLKLRGITTIQSLERCSADDLLEIRNFGITGLAEVRKFLASHGKSLLNEQPDATA